MEVIAGILLSILSFFGGFIPVRVASFAGPSHVDPPHATVLFGGDMMFDRTIRAAIDEKGGDFIFSCIDPVLQKTDLVVANLEGPITATSSKSTGSAIGAPDNFVFTFPTSTAPLLFAHNIKLVNLGNNHILNFGQGGVISTMAALADADVNYFGDPVSDRVAKKDINGIPLAFINYNEFGGDGSTTIAQIQEARAEGNIAIVYTHWGTEYATTSSAYSRELAHRFVEAGAELVIGSHPHVVQEREFYRGKYIYYSLGNLFFDQYWNNDVTHGLMIKVYLDKSGVQYVQEIPVELGRDRRTCVVSS